MGYDLLGDLGISIPVSGVSAPSRSTESHKIMRPRMRAPRTPRGSQRGSETPRSTATTTTGTVHGGEDTGCVIHMSPARGLRTVAPNQVFNETDRTILRVAKIGRKHDEYEVYNSAVPSNLAYNQRQSKAHQGKEAIQRERDYQSSVAKLQSDRESLRIEHENEMEKKIRQKHELGEWNSRKIDFDNQKRAEEAAADRRRKDIISENYEHEVDKKRESLIQQHRSKEIWREELQRLIADKSRKESAKSEARREECYPGLVVGSVPEPKSVTRNRARKIQSAWDEQLNYKDELRQAESRRSASFSTRLREQDFEKTRQAEDDKLMKRIKNMNFTREQKAMAHDKAQHDRVERARETHADRQRVERSRSVGDKILKNENEMRRSKSQAFRESLVSQIAQRVEASSAQQQERLRPGITHNGLGTAEPRKILLRCPETGQLLPPSAFNIYMGTKPRLRVP